MRAVTSVTTLSDRIFCVSKVTMPPSGTSVSHIYCKRKYSSQTDNFGGILRLTEIYDDSSVSSSAFDTRNWNPLNTWENRQGPQTVTRHSPASVTLGTVSGRGYHAFVLRSAPKPCLIARRGMKANPNDTSRATCPLISFKAILFCQWLSMFTAALQLHSCLILSTWLLGFSIKMLSSHCSLCSKHQIVSLIEGSCVTHQQGRFSA